MHRDDDLRPEVFVDARQSYLRALSVGFASRVHQDDVRVIELLYQSHVTENPCIALMID